MAKYTTGEVASQVLDGKWGSGDDRKRRLTEAGYDYDKVQKRVNDLLAVRKKMCSKAKKIAKDGTYHYVKWKSGDKKTQECPICHDHPQGAYHGWNCIGFAFAVWHHAGLASKCNCGVVSNEAAEKILHASDKDALKMAQDRIGLKDIMVIRNGGRKIPSSDLQAGDICECFDGDHYKHTIFYMGGGKVADCTSGRNPNIKTTSRLSSYQKRMPIKVAFRYIGANPAKKVPSLTLKKTSDEVIADAIKFGKWIAGDNRFHYGHGKDAHHNGCYFCGTQPKSKKKSGIKEWETTYCCNPFVTACLAHGGGLPEALKLCSHGKSWDMGNGSGSYAKSPLFDNLGKIPKEKLCKGDVLTGYGNGHVMLYIGNGKIVHAGHEDDNKVDSKSWNSSITVTSSFSYEKVYRYNGDGFSCKRAISHGEVSDRVAVLQRYLGITDDRLFGDDTKKAVEKWQKKHGLTPSGVVGAMTIRKMKESS